LVEDDSTHEEPSEPDEDEVSIQEDPDEPEDPDELDDEEDESTQTTGAGDDFLVQTHFFPPLFPCLTGAALANPTRANTANNPTRIFFLAPPYSR